MSDRPSPGVPHMLVTARRMRGRRCRHTTGAECVVAVDVTGVSLRSEVLPTTTSEDRARELICEHWTK